MAWIDRHNVHDRLLRRELGGARRYTNVKGLYGDKAWVKDLDIINELDGHTGCVNALRYFFRRGACHHERPLLSC